ncbi:GH36-type glycosyl hydrolase domain-containing protein [Vibrio breoganii]|uniref:GH36-type glycosyl hydrolase domain-containing protein n=1 Tax=Vibrio breoganii TaxID=553239 RepID=UPI0021C2BB1A|nr:amylo-alpha-1,6-glucosidase [Vibrio breoganii]MDN3715468.1 amylo-alpha-1,6-glucosidase [Vibrio breoganii]
MLITTKQNGERVELLSPTEMPRASGFLWNKKMMIQVNCRGYATAQFMQPEPAKYMHAPNLEAKSFMQPEQPYFAHHPGRFFYIKDEESGEIFSAPYEPVRANLDKYCFSLGQSDIQWQIEHLGIEIELCLSLPEDDVVELWQLKVKNVSGRARKLSVYPYFPIGYMSWMNQSAKYRQDLGGVVASCVTPYQKVADYFKNKGLKDKTFFLHDRAPTSYETIREVFEGEGGLHNPTGVQQGNLDNGDALYETPTAALQYQMELGADQQEDYRFLLGPAFDDAEIELKRDRYFADADFANTKQKYAAYVAQGKGNIEINTPDTQLNEFVNSWLPRQMFYHGDVNRLSTDPQTRNYIQDAMGMVYIKPDVTRAAFLHALAQQEESGAIPDGILLTEEAELKYINQIPHTDHCIWFPVCLRAYLDETNDYAIFDQSVQQFKGTETKTAFERINDAMRWLFNERDHRGLSYIAQGDWCDPMNMVGYKGKGVSGWLSMAAAYALNIWSDICHQLGEDELSEEFKRNADALNEAVNKHIWDGDWYARGITDDDVVFGTSKDEEGRIFLNPQSWAILANTADAEKRDKMIKQVEQQLETPYGVMMLAPSFTGMRDDVGRVTQKHPGSAENGSVYNHAAIFYIFSLYQAGETDRAFKLMSQMLAGPDEADYVQRGQLPVFIPNYYRGAYYQHPRTAGRSSQLFNTGTVSWVYRCIVEGLFGLKGCAGGLSIEPQLPADWDKASAVRSFRGATFEVTIQRADVTQTQVSVDGVKLSSTMIEEFEPGKTYKVEVLIA